MKWRNYDFTYSPMYNSNCWILKDAVEVLLNDDNIKPNWIEHAAEYTEFHIKRKKETLLIVVGESWAYGETLPGIATGIQKFNFYSQLEHCFGPKLAITLDADLYQYAVPGNCNFYMFKELKRILNHVSTMGYKKIRVCMQMTEPGREHPIRTELEKDNHPLLELYAFDKKQSFKEWLTKYDEIFFNEYDRLINEYPGVIESMLWKNFCTINTNRADRLFKIIDTSWIQYSGRILGRTIAVPSFYAVGWLATMQAEYSNYIEFNEKELLKELDVIELSNEFIKVNPLHSHHPNQYGHSLWAQFLARKAGWVDGL